jgi:hypothetical protein
MRIKISILTFCLVLATGSAAFAQGSGVIVGANFATLDVNPEQGPTFDRRTGLAAGIFFTLPLGPSLSVQPEVLYSQKGAKYKEGSAEATIQLDYVDIPVLARAGSSSGLVVFGGPSFGFKVRARLKTDFEGDSTEEDIGDQVESFDLGLVVGAGFQSGKFVLDGRYQWGLSNANKDEFENAEVKNRVISVMLGIRF